MALGIAQARAYRRAILMKTENRLNLSVWEYGKPQLYGRAVATVQAPAPFLTHDAGPESSTSTKTE